MTENESAGELRICLSLHIKDTFYSEKQIIDSLPKIIQLVDKKSINLRVTDGFVSIRYDGEELLGEKYWDDVHLVLNDIFYGLRELADGKVIRRPLPMQSVTLMLSLVGNFVRYELQPSSKRRENHNEESIVYMIPKKRFMRAFIFCYLRSVKIFEAIGKNARTLDEFAADDDTEDVIIGHNFKHVFANWQSYIPPNSLSNEDMDTIGHLMESSVDEWVARDGC
ncbi:MAG: hypothetical protein AAFV93_24385 [Chloroflexota bacterium]